MHTAFAQLQNNNWVFGNQGGFSFGPSGIKTYNTNIFCDENGASVSDRKTGKLLFYTDGVDVFDSTFTRMPNGEYVGYDIVHSSAQGSLIVPFSTDTNKYYLFTLEEWSTPQSYLRYSVIDMKLNGGNGDVVPGQKAIIIDSNLTEALTAINSCSQTWIATIKKGTNDFSLIRITDAGIDPVRVVSPKSYPFAGKGLIIARFSPDVRKLAIAIGNGVNSISYIALHDFDISTGHIINGVVIDTVFGRDEFYGCEFSPDSKKLFANGIISKTMYQYNLEYKDPTAIRASRKPLATTTNLYFGAPQLGPDNNIYFQDWGTQYIQKISNPNAMSPGCTYVPQAILLSSAGRGRRTFPQLIRIIGEKPYIRGTTIDTTICNSRYTIRADKNHVSYLWNDSTTADTLFITQSGIYTVKITDSCFDYTDTFKIVLEPALSLDLGPDTAVCQGLQITLKNRLASQGTALWNTGSTKQQLQVTSPGTYWLRLTYNVCSLSDTIRILSVPKPVVNLGNDTAICEQDSIRLVSNAQLPGSSYAWSNGDTTTTIHVKGKTAVSLTVDYMGCRTTDTILIDKIPLPYAELGGDTLMCYGKSLTLPLTLFADDSTDFLWNDGSKQPRLTLHDNRFVKLNMSNRCGVFQDSVTVLYRVCEVWLPTAFSPNGDGINDFFHLLGDIKNVSFFRLLVYNRWGQMVYSADDARSGWDGRFKGKDAEMGTYYYMMKLVYNGLGTVLSQTWKGDITLLR